MPAECEKKSVSTRARCLLIVFFAFLDSLYLLYHHVRVNGGFEQGQSMCNLGGSFNCDKVAESPYAEVFGIPIACFGLLYYLFFLVFLLFRAPKSSASEEDLDDFVCIVLVLSFLALPSTLWFASLSLFLIKYVCISCSILYLTNILLCLVAWRAQERRSPFLSSFWRGLRLLIGLFIPAAAPQDSRKEAKPAALFCWNLLVLVVFPIFVFLAPGLLTTYYLVPQQQTYRTREHLSVFLDQWRKSPQHEIPIDDSGSLFARDFSLGSPQALLTVVEFSDFRCPACRRASKAFKSIVDDSQGQVRVVFKNYPLDPACNPMVKQEQHSFSCQAAVMARCAGLQGEEQFWKMHDALFELGIFGWRMESVLDLPQKLGFGSREFDQCVSSEEVLNRVRDDALLGAKLEIRGTPTLYIKGRRLSFDRLEMLPGLIQLILEDER